MTINSRFPVFQLNNYSIPGWAIVAEAYPGMEYVYAGHGNPAFFLENRITRNYPAIIIALSYGRKWYKK